MNFKFDYFLVYYSWTLPHTINFVHGSHIKNMDIIGHVATVPGPLAFTSRGARPPACPSRRVRPQSVS